jgi:hypothetical protein
MILIDVNNMPFKYNGGDVFLFQKEDDKFFYKDEYYTKQNYPGDITGIKAMHKTAFTYYYKSSDGKNIYQL